MKKITNQLIADYHSLLSILEHDYKKILDNMQQNNKAAINLVIELTILFFVFEKKPTINDMQNCLVSTRKAYHKWLKES